MKDSYFNEEIATAKVKELADNNFEDYQEYMLEESMLLDNAIARMCLYTRCFSLANDNKSNEKIGNDLRDVVKEAMRSAQEKADKFIDKSFPTNQEENKGEH